MFHQFRTIYYLLADSHMIITFPLNFIQILCEESHYRDNPPPQAE